MFFVAHGLELRRKQAKQNVVQLVQLHERGKSATVFRFMKQSVIHRSIMVAYSDGYK